MRIAVQGFAAMVRDAVLRTASHHEVRMGCDATPSALILRSAPTGPREARPDDRLRARLEGWPRFGIAALALAFGLMLAAGGTAGAQTDDYPNRTVTFICPFPAGGGTDILVRLLAAELQDKLKRPVVVDNRVGGGTVIAASAVAKSPPDGYTLFLAPVTTLAIGPSIYKKLPYDTVKDFAPVGLVGSAQ